MEPYRSTVTTMSTMGVKVLLRIKKAFVSLVKYLSFDRSRNSRSKCFRIWYALLALLFASVFVLAVAYKCNYMEVPASSGHTDPLKKVKIGKITESPNHAELQKRPNQPQTPRMALVKGHVGFGKTNMNQDCIKVIEDHRKNIIETLRHHVSQFLDFLEEHNFVKSGERQTVENKDTETRKLIELLGMVTMKDDFCDLFVPYLKANGFKHLASKLESSPNETNDSPASSIIADFKDKLANYYRTTYSRIPTVYGHSIPIEKVWIPLKIEDNTEFPRISEQQSGFDHLELLKRLTDPQNPSIALVKGQPGVGKTTLVKKIAYDWATGIIEHFSLVLAVPLRHVYSTQYDFLKWQ